jgi:probable HAF family extracellular repeat protein
MLATHTMASCSIRAATRRSTRPTLSILTPEAINASGLIVGYYSVGAGTIGFLLGNGGYTSLVPGSDAEGINASGQIVGSYWDGTTYHGFVFDKGSYTIIDPPGSTYSYGVGINASGHIAGYYIDASGRFHGFLAAPVH